MKDLLIDMCEWLEKLTQYDFDTLQNAFFDFMAEGAEADEPPAVTLKDFICVALENDL